MNPVVAGAVLGALGVALGAFGAHGLKRRVGPEQLAIFETGVRYQLVHALALLAQGAGPLAGASTVTTCFVAGVVLFSGSLYALALGAPRRLGLVTPFGGALLIACWVALALAATGP